MEAGYPRITTEEDFIESYSRTTAEEVFVGSYEQKDDTLRNGEELASAFMEKQAMNVHYRQS